MMGEDIDGTTSRKASGGGVRHLAPELIEHDDALGTANSDAYSFAMLILECITEKTLLFDPQVHGWVSKKRCPP